MNSSYIKKFFFFFLIACVQISLAQTYHFKNYKNDGFPQNQIFAIHQDKNGFLWFGTGVGLSRYDSEKFVNFTVEDGLPANEVLSLASNDTTLWVGTGLGLAVFDNRDIYHPRIAYASKELSHYPISNLLFQQNKLWVGTKRKGLFVLSLLGEKGNSVKKLTGEIDIKDIKSVGDDSVLVLTEKGLELYRNGIRVDSFDFDLKEGLRCITRVRNNRYWLDARSGLYEIDLKNKSLHAIFPELKGFEFNRFCKDSSGATWAATDKGIIKFQDNKFEIISRSKGLPGNDIRGILVDNEGNLWLGSYTNGLFKLTNTSMINYTENQGLLSNVCNALLQENPDQVLVGTDQGIFTIRDQNLSRDNRFDALNDAIIWFIYRDRENKIWIGGQNILYTLEKGKLKPFESSVKDGDCTFLDMLQDTNGTYWFCTTIGLFSVNGKDQHFYPQFADSGIQRVWEVYELSDGRVLFGTDNGLVIKKEDSFKYIRREDGLPDRAVYVIHEDKHHKVWLGCDLGLIEMLDDNSFRLIGSGDGLHGLIISQILETDGPGFWLCSDKGLQHFINDKPGEVYGIKDGFAGEEFTTQNSSFIDSKGNFWLGLFGGLTIFNPSNTRYDGAQVRVYLQKAEYFSSSQKRHNMLGIQAPLIGYNNNNVLFQPLGIYYYNEQSLEFYYKLDGLDNEWQTAKRGENIRYNNLGPGKYALLLKTQIDNHVSENVVLRYDFAVDRPFWMKPWFFALVLGISISSLLSVYYTKTKRYRDVNRELQSQIDLNIKELALAQATIENVIENIGSAIVTTDTKGRITTWNKSAEEIFGYSKDFILQKNINLMDLEDDLFSFVSILDEIKMSGQLRQLEVRKRTARGEIIDLIMTATALSDEKGKKPDLFTFNMEDFSERNRLLELRINREKLLAGIEALNKLLATLSHYINNSTAAISGMSQLVEMDDSYTPKFQEITKFHIKRIQAVLSSLGHLVERLNLKTKDYVGEKDRLFDIESEIAQFLKTVENISKNMRLSR